MPTFTYKNSFDKEINVTPLNIIDGFNKQFIRCKHNSDSHTPNKEVVIHRDSLKIHYTEQEIYEEKIKKINSQSKTENT